MAYYFILHICYILYTWDHEYDVDALKRWIIPFLIRAFSLSHQAGSIEIYPRRRQYYSYLFVTCTALNCNLVTLTSELTVFLSYNLLASLFSEGGSSFVISFVTHEAHCSVSYYFYSFVLMKYSNCVNMFF